MCKCCIAMMVAILATAGALVMTGYYTHAEVWVMAMACGIVGSAGMLFLGLLAWVFVD